MKMLAGIALFVAIAGSALGANAPAPDGKPHQFTLHDNQFWVDQTPMRVFAGEMHPGRILPEFWDDRIKKAKAMGLNTVSVYLFWDQIEPTEGSFVFKDQTEIRRFAKLCQDNGMWMIVRAGPYICGEWDFGGLPGWLLKHPGLHIRQNEPQFMAYSKKYLEEVGKQLADMQVGHGGPIIMTQVENELHRIDDYLKALQEDFIAAGFDGQLMTCDPSGQPWTTLQGLPNVLRGYNGFDPQDRFEMRYTQSTAVNKATGYPVFSPEVYTGWFATFGNWGPAKSPKVDVETQVARVKFLFDHKDATGRADLSWCLYVFNGGTNFGFTSGANANHPMQTSYDYDAPVDEMGRVTPKYRALRELYMKSLDLTLPEIPADPKVIEVPMFSLKEGAALVDRLPEKEVESEDVLSMEDVNQNFGFVDYRKTFPKGIKGALDVGQPRDYVSIMVNGEVVGEKFNGMGGPGRVGPTSRGATTAGRGAPAVATTAVDVSGPCTLDILVHNLGRNSLVTSEVGQRKGLMTNPTLDGTALTGWKIYSMPMDDANRLPSSAAVSSGVGPTFYSGTFTIAETGETYLDMSKWHFGVVWVNGHNLGRYWEVGTSRAIYLPSAWQKKGENEITVLELGPGPASAEITGVKEMVETPATRVGPLWNKAATTQKDNATERKQVP